MGALQADPFWDLDPIRYTDTPASDAIAEFGKGLAAGTRRLEGATDLEKLRYVLRMLDVPEESQILVFSQTSHQNRLIRPGNPRCLFYSENAYVGYVPGGDIEVVMPDPVLGTVFYLIDLEQKDPARVVIRDTAVCLSCHGTGRTESVPGVLVRSVRPDADGHLLLHLGTDLIDARSPIPSRWGGYYVTGRSSLPHLGNRTYEETDTRASATAAPVELGDLSGTIDVSKYPRATSDIVSLMVLEHQCRIYNLLVAGSMEYRRYCWLRRSLDGPAGRVRDGADEREVKMAASLAAKIVDALLFKDEAPMGEGGVDGDVAFQDAFAKRFPKTREGDSLADFQLGSRMFKHRCSYMVYSQAFDALPAPVKSAVAARLKDVLESGRDFPEMKAPERARIAAILEETLPAYAGGA